MFASHSKRCQPRSPPATALQDLAAIRTVHGKLTVFQEPVVHSLTVVALCPRNGAARVSKRPWFTERRRVGFGIAPLLDPLPTPSSWGEAEKSRLQIFVKI